MIKKVKDLLLLDDDSILDDDGLDLREFGDDGIPGEEPSGFKIEEDDFIEGDDDEELF
jgi:hypothetical protein